MLRKSDLIMSVSRLKVSIVGLRAFNQIGDFVKPTTRMIQIFGHYATMARLEIDEGQRWKLAAGEIFPVDMEIDMPDHYDLDYSKAKPNRFASILSEQNGYVKLNDDVREFFKTSEQVNNALRAIISAYPQNSGEQAQTL